MATATAMASDRAIPVGGDDPTMPRDVESEPNGSGKVRERAHTPEISPRRVLDTPKTHAAIRRSYDMRLMPAAFVAWLIFYIDRANIGLARINDLDKDLNLKGSQFNVALLLFAVFHVLFNIPGNLLLRRVGGGLWLSTLIVSWGLITLASGFIKDFAGLCITRVFLGIAESSFLGCMLLYLGLFYTHDEIVGRIGIFYSSTPLAASIGGLLAGGLGRIKYRGYNGWCWIFFIEGAMTIVVGVAAYYILPNTPGEARFLSPGERLIAVSRMRTDGDVFGAWHPQHSFAPTSDLESGSDGAQDPAARDRLEWATVVRAVFSPITVLMAIGCFLTIGAGNSYGFFLPTIIENMGFEKFQATLMTVPPNFVAFVFVLIITQWSQRRSATGWPLTFCAAIGAFGFLLLLVGSYTGRDGPVLSSLQYIGTFFAGMSVMAIPPLALAWISVNASPFYVRAISLGLIIGFGSFAALISSVTYIKTAAPQYIAGHSINLGFLAALVVIGITVINYMKWENGKRERGERDYRLDESRLNGLDRTQYELQLGWKHPMYRLKI